MIPCTVLPQSPSLHTGQKTSLCPTSGWKTSICDVSYFSKAGLENNCSSSRLSFSYASSSTLHPRQSIGGLVGGIVVVFEVVQLRALAWQTCFSFSFPTLNLDYWWIPCIDAIQIFCNAGASCGVVVQTSMNEKRIFQECFCKIHTFDENMLLQK